MDDELFHQNNLHNALEWYMANIETAVNGFIIHVNPSGKDERLSGRLVFTKKGMKELPDVILERGQNSDQGSF